MAQRVVTSVALLRAPDVVIADEPTSGLDADLVERTAQHLSAIADRCTQVHAQCRAAVPALTDLADGAVRCVLYSGARDGAAARVVA